MEEQGVLCVCSRDVRLTIHKDKWTDQRGDNSPPNLTTHLAGNSFLLSRTSTLTPRSLDPPLKESTHSCHPLHRFVDV
ncbi:hypothetical protein VTK73DRAFT_1586 [Phialemonium thermophilum]|uniref:Uncharacterized protein n=1 Tax=Phialemonium thermophilum TaxID=223376 RepID=A0ABR3Y3S6_9PEZI